MAQWLEHWIFIREDPGSIPTKGGIFFQLCFIPLLRLSCRKMGARPGLDFIRRKWLHVIINDDFLEKGECYERAPGFDSHERWNIFCAMLHSFVTTFMS